MKNIKWIFIIAGMVLMSACTDLEDLNRDPTKPTEIDPGLLIPTVQFSHSYGFQNCARYLTYPGNWTNHWTGPYGPVYYGGAGQKELSYMERLWNIIYVNGVRNLVALEDILEDDPQMANYKAIANVLRVETFLKLTDYYGDVPYSEAGRGHVGVAIPKYDRQEDIYNDFFARLDEALSLFNEALPVPTGDMYYAGNVAQWKRFTNSLKLRIAMRLIKVDEDKAKQKAREAFEGGLMTSNADIATVKHDADDQDLGPGNGYANFMAQWHAARGPSQFRLTTDFFNSLTIPDTDSIVGQVVFRRIKAQDPRLLLLARSYTLEKYGEAADVTEFCRSVNSKNPNQQGPADLTKKVDGYINIGGYLTVPAQDYAYGGGRQSENLAPTVTDRKRDVWAAAIKKADYPDIPYDYTHYTQRLQPSKWINAPDAPYVHMSYAETQFLMAETTLRGWGIDTETAATRYENGYMAAVQQWSLFKAPVPSDTEIKAYMNTYLMPIISGGGTAALEEVCKQLWTLFHMDPIEAWSLIRRTDGMPTAYTTYYNRYPNDNQTGGKMPRRIQYPIEEAAKNRDNFNEAVARMGGKDDWMNRVWWDVE